MRVALILMALATTLAGGCADNATEPGECTKSVSYRADEVRVRFETDAGPFIVAVDGAKAPVTACNFLGYVESEFYDDSRIHRVRAGFVLQAGGCDADGTLKKTLFAPIVNEAHSSGLLNVERTLSMARMNAPDSATSQFFVNLVDNRGLDPGQSTAAGYAVFGRVVDGWSTVLQIEDVPVRTPSKPGPCAIDEPSQPVTPLIIQRARVVAA